MKKLKIEGSSNIAEIGYDPEICTMEIKFHNGNIYRYYPITKKDYRLFSKAESKGAFFAKNIRNNPTIYYQKLDSEMQG